MGVLDGKVAIVTGGGRGIGREICLLAAQEGAKVIVADLGAELDGSGQPSSGPANETVEMIKKAGGEAMAQVVDVTNHQQCEELVGKAIETYGKLDIAVTPAGILRDRMVFNMAEEEWDAVMDVHLKGTFNIMKFASIHWRTTRAGGRFIGVSSSSGLYGAAGQPNYAAAKHGIVGLVYSSANALAKYNVTCNAIIPQAYTRMTETIVAPGTEDYWKSDEMSPRHIAPAVVYLASDDAAWCNGQVIGIWGRECRLYSQYQVMSSLYNSGPWDPEDLGPKFKAEFEPLLSGKPDGS
jgi:NAD(P)-dependent dehydrogenase (short-subunit alcohol dehydrogenase family)